MQLRFQSYFNSAQKIIELFKGEMPLSSFLKKYFALNKKMGSADRKQISQLCFGYYRVAKSVSSLPIETKLKISIFICNKQLNNYTFLFNDDWVNNWTENLNERVKFIEQNEFFFLLDDVFNYNDKIGDINNYRNFVLNHFVQPNLFIRIRPSKEHSVFEKLNLNNISFSIIEPNCISLLNSTKIDSVVSINKDVVIQDWSSQQIKHLLLLVKKDYSNSISVWDCCAASGGKSILAKDVLGNIDLTVSDIRPSILDNLQIRFNEASIIKYISFTNDLSKPIQLEKNFDLIICDAPCTGSGTWSRTPEENYFFNESKILEYSALQKKIVKNSIPHLKNGGYFLYITCSVFNAENEDVVKYILENTHLKLVVKNYFEGAEINADTMFAALFK